MPKERRREMIHKKKAIYKLREFGDAIITIIGETGKREIAATIDFDNKYIKSIRKYKRFQFKGNILVFNWTDNIFEAIPTRTIVNIEPMSGILNNVR